MTKSEIIAEVKEQMRKGNHPEYEMEIAGVEITQEDQVGGEDEGSDYYYVMNFKTDTENFNLLISGHYDSNNGTDFTYGDVTEVVKGSRTVECWNDKDTGKLVR